MVKAMLSCFIFLWMRLYYSSLKCIKVALAITFLILLLLFIFYHTRYFSVVAPGDTVHVIGEFDAQAKCDVNREKNFLIVHPDILVSGTRVLPLILCNFSFLLLLMSIQVVV